MVSLLYSEGEFVDSNEGMGIFALICIIIIIIIIITHFTITTIIIIILHT